MNSIAPITSDYFSVTDTSVRTTSLKVAEAFGKRHGNVLSKLKALECSPEFTELNFKFSEYSDTTGRPLPMVEMTKDGFMFLVMGFTGKKAAAIKEAYILAFNEMAEQLAEPSCPRISRKAKKYHYPRELLAQAYFQGPNERITGLGVSKLASANFSSPLGLLLTELNNDGHDVSACQSEYHAMRGLMFQANDMLTEMYTKIFKFTHGSEDF